MLPCARDGNRKLPCRRRCRLGVGVEAGPHPQSLPQSVSRGDAPVVVVVVGVYLSPPPAFRQGALISYPVYPWCFGGVEGVFALGSDAICLLRFGRRVRASHDAATQPCRRTHGCMVVLKKKRCMHMVPRVWRIPLLSSPVEDTTEFICGSKCHAGLMLTWHGLTTLLKHLGAWPCWHQCGARRQRTFPWDMLMHGHLPCMKKWSAMHCVHSLKIEDSVCLLHGWMHRRRGVDTTAWSREETKLDS